MFLLRAKRMLFSKHKLDKVRYRIWGYQSKKKQDDLIKYVDQAQLCVGISDTKYKHELVLSLTSYPKRFQTLPMTIKSLLLQDMKPNRIIVWYDCDENELTAQLLELEKYGVDFIHVEGKLGPHTKYFYAMQTFPDGIIITVDDDMYYPPDLISTLYDTYIEHPDCICARRVHKMQFSGKRQFKKYRDWRIYYRGQKEESYTLFAQGCSGVLYPPNSLDKRAFDKEKIVKRCLWADDIWLKFMEVLNGRKVVWARNDYWFLPTVEGSQGSALLVDNVRQDRNDSYIHIMNECYGDEFWEMIEKGNHQNG